MPAAEDRPLGEILPKEEIIDGCKTFMNCCFQLHFLSKVRFLAHVERDPGSINQFLLTCILGLSARFTPSLIKRFGGAEMAADVFIQRAEQLALAEIYKPTLETVQGLILLGASEWAKGECNKGLIHLGVASTVTGMLRLHKEDTYTLPDDAQPEDIIYSEAARRTLWMMGLLRNLFAGHHSPVPFALDDLTALLPCEENEFAFGIIPKVRAALPTSQAAIDHPELVNPPSRTLFATVIQAYKYWGQVARYACLDTSKSKNSKISLWDNASQYCQLSMTLSDWEGSFSKEHMWSEWNLRVYRAENMDIAYASIFLATRLGNIVLRRTYLEEIKAGILGKETNTVFLESMSQDLFTNVIALREGIELYLSIRPVTEGFPPLLAFSIYLCGSLATHLWRYPQLCPQLARRAEGTLQWSKDALMAIYGAWPIATHWHKALEVASEELPSLSVVDIPEPYRTNPDFASLDVTLASGSGSSRAPRGPMLGPVGAPTEISSSSTDPMGLLFGLCDNTESGLTGSGGAEFLAGQTLWS